MSQPVSRGFQTVDSFTGLWKPTTAGERLVHFLSENADCFSQAPLTPHDTLHGIPRGMCFRDFLHGCLLFHGFARLTQVAKHYRTTCLDDELKALAGIRRFAIEQLELAPGACRRFEELPRVALDAAAAASESSKTPKRRVKKNVLDACNQLYRCYSCDALLDPVLKDSRANNYLTFDHLWPHSQGGDSIEENLAIACRFCNGEKRDAVLWQWHLIQSLVPVTTLGDSSVKSTRLQRTHKMALHSRAAFAYARTFGTTLKAAFAAIGPRLPNIQLVDPDDTPDFFNLTVHDVSRTASLW